MEDPFDSLTPALPEAQRGVDNRVDWRFPGIDVVRDSKNRPVWCLATGAEILATHPLWRDALAYNEFQRHYMLLRPVPGTPPDPTFQPREIRDQDVSGAVQWLNRNGFPNATRSVVYESLCAAADRTVIDPLRFYLEDLKWDGRPRLSTWLEVYAGADGSDFTAEAGKRWMISAVARGLSPGCKADAALVLEGPQGSGKSSLLRLMAGADYFGDALMDFESKDASIYLRGKWIVEMAELTAMSRAAVEAVRRVVRRMG